MGIVPGETQEPRVCTVHRSRADDFEHVQLAVRPTLSGWLKLFTRVEACRQASPFQRDEESRRDDDETL